MKNQRGFTLIEFLIAMTVATFIFLSASAVIGVLFSSSARTKQIDTLEQVRNDLMQEMSNTIRWANKDGISCSPCSAPNYLANSLTVQIGSETITYTLTNKRLYKKTSSSPVDEPLTPTTVDISNWSIADRSRPPHSLVTAEISLDLQHTQFSAVHDTVRFVVSQRRTQVEIQE